jgi:hypothetical protein
MLVLLLACTDVSPLEAAAPKVDVATWEALTANEDDPALGSTTTERRGAVRFSDAGPIAADGDGWEGRQSLPVVEAEAGVRVRDEVDGVRLLTWLDRDDLMSVVAEGAWVDASGQRVREGGAGAYLRPGRQVEFDAEGAWLPAGWPLRSQVRVPDTLLDEWYVPTALPAEGEGPEVQLARNARLLDDRGAELGVVHGDYTDVVLLDRDGDVVLVELTTGGCGGGEPVRGWVDIEEVDEDPEFRYGRGYCCGFGWGTWGVGTIGGGGTTLLPVERLLWDAPDGEIVGVVTGHGGYDPVAEELIREPVRMIIDADAGEMPGWTAVLARVNTGSVTVWARDEGGDLDDLEPPEE